MIPRPTKPTTFARVLEALRREGAAGPTRLATALGAPRGTVANAVRRLLEEGKIEQLDDGTYRLATRPPVVHALTCDMGEDCTCGAGAEDLSAPLRRALVALRDLDVATPKTLAARLWPTARGLRPQHRAAKLLNKLAQLGHAEPCDGGFRAKVR